MKIAVVGLWHLGEVHAASLASLGNTVVGIGEKDVVENLKKGIPPLAEPGLAPMLKNPKLTFSSEYSAVRTADIVWITFDTPVGKNDRADTSVVTKAVQKILPHIKKDAVVVVSSQLPVGTSRKIQAMLLKRSKNLGYAYVPENLRLGEAIKSFMEPERVVVGAADARSAKFVQLALKGLPAEFHVMNPASAEIVKHALNAFLATSLSFIYDIADVAEAEGADILEVSKALKSDSRIGQKAYLDASLGFAGGTLGRDLQYLRDSAKRHRGNVPVIAAVFEKNQKRRESIVARLRSLGSLRGKRIAMLGLTYKAGTPTLRRSMALEMASILAKKGAELSLFDPAVSAANIQAEFPRAHAGSDVYEALRGAHACIIITPWQELRSLDWKQVAKGMRKPRFFLDSRNYLADISDTIRKSDIAYRGIGR